ncbi:MAG: hypothetical protein WCF10_10070 [Polyangiales bacterium]
MDAKRWTLGVVLAATVGLWGLMEADASPFSSYILSDDLGNIVNGAVPDASEWNDPAADTTATTTTDTSGTTTTDTSGTTTTTTDTSGTTTTTTDTSGTTTTDTSGKSNNGHGNNADGVDSSNPGKGKGGPNGAVDASCTDPSNCVDDETSGGSSGSAATSDGTTTTTTTTDTTSSPGNSGKAKKNK